MGTPSKGEENCLLVPTETVSEMSKRTFGSDCRVNSPVIVAELIYVPNSNSSANSQSFFPPYLQC